MRLILFMVLIASYAHAQTGKISGKVIDRLTQRPLAAASIAIVNSDLGAQTDQEGKYEIANIPVGSVQVKCTFKGYKEETSYNVIIISGATQDVNFELDKESKNVGDITVKGRKATAVAADIVTPLSVQKLTATEIKSNPGGNFDISRVIQALPGVSGATASASFRNDIIIRGGAPNENIFFLDGIEIPVINHFQTQGASGGPTGMLNVSFIEDVKLASSAFDARYDNALSSVFQFKQREGNAKNVDGNFRLSGTEAALTLEGPLSKNTTFLASVRRSYLQFLFQLIDLPIRPNYWDFQYKTTTKLNSKTTLSFLGLGAIDDFTTVATKNSTPENEYIQRSVPYINQWNYTTGASLKRLTENGFYTISLSRNMFDNRIDRFEDKKQNIEEFRNLGLNSQEIENKLRADFNTTRNGWRISYGGITQYVKFNNDLYSKINILIPNGVGGFIPQRLEIESESAIKFFKYGLYGQVGRKFLDDKMSMSFGLRTDMNSFTDDGNNPLKALSPRMSASYAVAPKWQINASVGRYAKLPIYTALGYRDSNKNLVNRGLDYIISNHAALGVEYLPKSDLRVTGELFYKRYNNYLVNRNTGISLANEGVDFLAIGNAPFDGNGLGRVYGAELFVQKKLTKKIFATCSYTYYHSQFAGADGIYRPSAWDNRHLFSGIFGKKMKRNWEIGMKLRITGQSPWTPFDTLASKASFVLNGTGITNYKALNTNRLRPFWQYDFRIDKKINYKRRTLDLFLDVQNALLTVNDAIPTFVLKRNDTNTDFITTDGLPLKQDGSNGVPLLLQNTDALATPTIGIIVEF